MDGSLIHMVSDLLKPDEGRELRRLFNERPERVMDLYDLSEPKRQCFYRMSPEPIALEIRGEVSNWQGAAELPDLPDGQPDRPDLLMHLVSDLMHSPTLMDTLRRHQAQVLDHYRIKYEHRRILNEKNAESIAAAVFQEGSNMEYPGGPDFPDDEEPDSDEHTERPAGPPPEILYPSVVGYVWRARPPSVRAGEFQLVVLARSAPRGGRCAVRLEPTRGGDPIPAGEVVVSGTFRKSVLRCRFEAPRGTYRVVVESCPGTDYAYVFEGTPEVEVR